MASLQFLALSLWRLAIIDHLVSYALTSLVLAPLLSNLTIRPFRMVLKNFLAVNNSPKSKVIDLHILLHNYRRDSQKIERSLIYNVLSQEFRTYIPSLLDLKIIFPNQSQFENRSTEKLFFNMLYSFTNVPIIADVTHLYIPPC